VLLVASVTLAGLTFTEEDGGGGGVGVGGGGGVLDPPPPQETRAKIRPQLKKIMEGLHIARLPLLFILKHG
jgi:hypothetical protein